MGFPSSLFPVPWVHVPSESQTVIKTTPEVKQFCGTILTPFRPAHEPTVRNCSEGSSRYLWEMGMVSKGKAGRALKKKNIWKIVN